MKDSTKTRTAERETLIRLIRGEPLGPSLARCETQTLSRLAFNHKVITPLAHRIESEGNLPDSWRRWAAFIALASQRDARLRTLGARKTVDLLEGIGVSPVLLKGSSVALGKPRDVGDVDLLIPPASLKKVISLLETHGYLYRGFERNMYIRRREYRDWDRLLGWANQFEFTDPDTGTLIELHTHFFERGRVYTEDLSVLHDGMDQFVAASVVDPETGFRFLSLEDRALLMALHAGVKRSPERKGFVLRQLLDLRYLVDTGLCWESLERRAFQFNAAHHLFFLLRLFERFAGPCAPPGYVEGIEAKLPKSLLRLQYLHLRCLRDVGSYNRGAIFAYRFLSPFVLRSSLTARLRSLLIFPLILPYRWNIEKIYGLNPRSRLAFFFYLLEPGRLVYRTIRKLWRLCRTAVS